MVVTRSQAKAAAAAGATGQDPEAVTKKMAALKISKPKVASKSNGLLDGDPEISDALYRKASKDNKSLSKLERILLFSRCDVLGKAFADPASLTEAQRNIILNRPPPEIVAQNIKDATDGAMSTIGELMAADVSSLGKRALTLIYNMYQTRADPAIGLGSEPMAKKHDPAYFLCRNPEAESGDETEGPIKWAADLYTTPEDVEWQEQVSSAYWTATEDDDDDDYNDDGDDDDDDDDDDEDDDDDDDEEEEEDDDDASIESEAELPGYREEKERLEPEMRAQLADKIKQLTDAERTELKELTQRERELCRAEDAEFQALLDKMAADEAERYRLAAKADLDEKKGNKTKTEVDDDEDDEEEDEEEEDEATESDDSETEDGESVASDDLKTKTR